MRALGLGHVGHHDVGLLGEGCAEAQAEVHRHPEDQGEVAALERRPSRAGEEQGVVGGQAAAG
jgi:hypothetical protein